MSHAPAPTAAPLIGFGQVRHTRLRPRRHAFAYPTFFLMLPMRSLRSLPGALAVNRRGAISFHDVDHGDGRSAAQGGALAWLDELLHTDTSVLPQRRAAWAAWNYERAQQKSRESARVCLHYLINQLQPVPFAQPVVVSLNPVRDIAPEHVIGSYEYAHPVFDMAAIRAQQQVGKLQGQQHTWFCGAWTGYGFHEDGLKSGLAVAEQLRAALPATLAEAA